MADVRSPHNKVAEVLNNVASSMVENQQMEVRPLIQDPSPIVHTPSTPPTALTTSSVTPTSHVTPRLTPFVEGFKHALEQQQGAVPFAWNDREKASIVMAESIPLMTAARLIVYARDTKQNLPIMAARVLTDMFAREPGLLELTPEEAAQEGAMLMQSMWPQAAFQQRVVVEPEVEVKHPVLEKIKKLSGQWHRLAGMPIDHAKQKNPTLWRAKVLNDIAIAKAEALHAGLTKGQIMLALESSGDRWSWEIPPAAMGFFSDEFGAPPEGSEVTLASMPN